MDSRVESSLVPAERSCVNDTDHRYVLELFRENGDALGQVPLEPDWEPLKESLRFEMLRIAPTESRLAAAPIRTGPVWSPAAGAPYVGSLRAEVVRTSGESLRCDVVSTRYLRRHAHAVSAGLVERGVLVSGERFRYAVTAFPTEAEPAHPSEAFAVDDASELPPVQETAIEVFLKRAKRLGPSVPPPFPVFIPQSVLQEAEERVREAGPLETGGILVGFLHRDLARGELFVEVTAQIPATHAESGTHRLGFTPATWQAVRAALDLRRRSELMLGWYHSHGGSKYWCSSVCSAEDRKQCRLNQSFFSSDDVALHRTVFFRAYTIALVFTHTDTAIECSAYGWHEGTIEARGFDVLDAAAADSPISTAASASIGGNEYATPCAP